jgi:hypothetical protein
MPHYGAETAAHGAVARMTTTGPQEMTVQARLGVVADLVSRRYPFRARALKCRVVSAWETHRAPKPSGPHNVTFVRSHRSIRRPEGLLLVLKLDHAV